MPDYDFRSLSPYDFQQLCRDLLQEELQIRLESFSHGRDQGIDLRCVDEGMVVQCKHFVDSPYETLLRVLRVSELPKVQELEPGRYIVATSQGLTPNRKAEIREVFDPYCISDDDVYGRDDLNNLLGRHPTIEEQNFKLWLTSDVVLRRIVRAGAVEGTARAVERMRERTRRYVQNPSFRRALDILEDRHYCIIAGIPGIGKTMLADVLLIHYVDRHQFTPIRISYDLSETLEAARWETRQVFYFDDFLGRTTLDKLRRNEDQRLVEFMTDVAENPRWRLILTTREYILNRARLRYETLSNADLDLQTCVLDLRDYTTQARAAILYNHVYFSDLPKAYKQELLAKRQYRKIAFHNNYSPRIIEHMTQARNVSSIPPQSYVKEFIAALDNPIRIWRHAFEEQISEASQQLLLVLGSLPNEVLLQDLEIAYEYFIRIRQQRRGYQPHLRDFEHALKELDGNFLSTTKEGEDVLVSFHNPSVEDFLMQYLSVHAEDVRDLLDSAQFFEQSVEVARGPRGTRSEAALQNVEPLEQSMRRLFSTESCRLMRYGDAFRTYAVRHEQPPSTERTSNVLEIAELTDSDRLRNLGEQLVSQLTPHLAGDVDRGAYASLARTIVKKGDSSAVEIAYVEAVKENLMRSAEEEDDFRAVIQLRDADPATFTAEELGQIGLRFVDLCRLESEQASSTSSEDELRTLAYSLDFIAKSLGVSAESRRWIRRIERLADEVAAEGDENPEPEQDWDDDRSTPLFDIDEMFDGLKHDLDVVEDEQATDGGADNRS